MSRIRLDIVHSRFKQIQADMFMSLEDCLMQESGEAVNRFTEVDGLLQCHFLTDHTHCTHCVADIAATVGSF